MTVCRLCRAHGDTDAVPRVRQEKFALDEGEQCDACGYTREAADSQSERMEGPEDV